MASPAQQPDPKYSLHADATNLFGFLKDSFFKMPRFVQVIGWMVFLFLFVFLVLYPLLGITYYQGHIISLSVDQHKKPMPTDAVGIQIYKEDSTTTNDHGEFTLGVHTPDIPFVGVDFTFQSEIGRETVSLPAPTPFLALFNPNRQKIFYVPSSTVQDKSGLFVKHYFLNETEARDALNQSIVGSSNASAGRHPGPGFNGVYAHQVSLPSIVYADEPAPAVRNYGLRIRELKIPNRNSTEAYFDVRIDGRRMHFDNLPDAGSPSSRDLTIYGDTPIRFDGLSLTIPETTRQVDISVYERKSFWQRDPLIGSVHFDVSPEKTSKPIAFAAGGMEITLELIPAMAISCTATTGKSGQYLVADYWLDISKENLPGVANVQYDLGPGFDNRYVSTPKISPALYYMDRITIFAPQAIKARVILTGGSTISLSTFCAAQPKKAATALEHYFLADVYYWADKADDASREISASWGMDATFQPARTLEANISAKLGKFDSAIAAYEEALRLSPDDPNVLNGYAWLIADQLPQPRISQLQDGKKRALRATQIQPTGDNLDTLGWLEFKLHEYDKAKSTLQKAAEVQKADPAYSSFQIIHYHLGRTYSALGNRVEAKRCFQAAIDFNYASSNPEYVQLAKAEIQKIR